MVHENYIKRSAIHHHFYYILTIFRLRWPLCECAPLQFIRSIRRSEQIVGCMKKLNGNGLVYVYHHGN